MNGGRVTVTKFRGEYLHVSKKANSRKSLGHTGELTLYPISLGFDEAVNRIEALLNNGHDAEALVTSVFTLEKTMRRSLKIAILSRGFSLKQSQRFTERKGFNELKEMWKSMGSDSNDTDGSYLNLEGMTGNWLENRLGKTK